MRRIAAAFCLLLQPAMALAEDWGALAHLQTAQSLMFLLILMPPLFFFPSGQRTFRGYLVLLVIMYGVMGVVGVPFSLISYAMLWFAGHIYAVLLPVLGVVLGFAASIWALRKYSAAALRAFAE